MILKQIEKVSMNEHGIHTDDDATVENKNLKDIDVDNRDQWMYVGLSDKGFELKRKRVAKRKENLLKEDEEEYSEDMELPFNTNKHLFMFGMYENEKSEKPFAYLAMFVDSMYTHKNYDEIGDAVLARSIALASEVDGWEMGRIQAMLVNRMLDMAYKGREQFELRMKSHNRIEAEYEDNVPFDGNPAVAKIASEENGFRMFKATMLNDVSDIEKDALLETTW